MSLDITADPGGSRKLQAGTDVPGLRASGRRHPPSPPSPRPRPRRRDPPREGIRGSRRPRPSPAIPAAGRMRSGRPGRGSFAPQPADGPALIRLDGGFEFDPRLRPDRIADSRRAARHTAGGSGARILHRSVQGADHAGRSRRDRVGGRKDPRLHSRLCPPGLPERFSASRRVAANERVSWSGLYQPAYKISRDPRMSERGVAEMDILLFHEESLDEVAAQIAACRREDPRGARQRDQQDHPRRDRPGRRRGGRPDPGRRVDRAGQAPASSTTTCASG